MRGARRIGVLGGGWSRARPGAVSGALAVALASAALVLTACVGLDEDVPREATLILEGDPAADVRVITSTRFGVSTNPQGGTVIDLVQADTLVRRLPFDTTLDIAGEGQIFTEAALLEDPVPLFRMRVLLDGEPTFTELGPLERSAPFRFVFSADQMFTTNLTVR